jgi:two-component system cell cycle sensor histidine kinase/response regulator CckA
LSDPGPRSQLSDLEMFRLAAVVESSEDAIVSKDLDGTIRSWNPAAERIFGYSREEMIGEPIFRLIPEELHAEEHQLLARIRVGEHVAHYETTRIRKDGQRIQISLTLSPVWDWEGRLIGASAIKRDITAQQALERQFRHSQQMDAIGQLAGGVAHDFNNILTVISGYCGLLLTRTPAPDPRREDVIGIQEAADRAAALTQQLLAFGRKQIMQPMVLDLREVIEDTGRMLRRLLGEHIHLAITTGPLLSPVFADRGQLSQVLVNLAVNARDAMPEGGSLTIEAQDASLSEEYAETHLAVAPGTYVRLAVSDTGAGMTTEIQARMFEPFFTTKPAGKGTGLGLSTVHGIVKQFGGHIFVYSEPEHGTTIKIYMPRAEAIAAAAAPRKQVAAARGSETILVVEDDAGILSVIRRMLEERGYPVLLAATPQLALELAAGHEGPIHLLLTDVVMPEMSGRQLAERLLRDWPGLPVLFMSGYTDDAMVHQGRLNPDTELLQKPFTTDTLLRRIRRVLYPGGSEPPSS